MTSQDGDMAAAIKDALRPRYGLRAFAELVTPDSGPQYILVLTGLAKDMALRSPAVRDSGLSVKTIIEAPRVPAKLSAPASLWTGPDGGSGLADELLPSEVIETAWQPEADGPRPVVVDHDFPAFAPKEVGWLHQAPSVQPVSQAQRALKVPKSVTAYAGQLSGTRYRLAAKTPGREMDCSGFVWFYFYLTRGIRLPRLARWQALATRPVSREAVVEGDLAFFAGSGEPAHHVGLVSGAAKEIRVAHCCARTAGVTIESADDVVPGAGISFGCLCDPM